MATATEPDTSPTSRLRRRGSNPAVWALACGTYAGALWAVVWFMRSYSDEGVFTRNPAPDDLRAAVAWALLGGVAGCPTGPLVWLARPRRLQGTLALFLVGPIWGALGCGSAAFTAVLLLDHLHPILSSSLAMAAVSAVVGYVGCRLSSRLDRAEAGRSTPSVLVGLGWGVSGAATTGAAWLTGCMVAYLAFGVIPLFELTSSKGAPLLGVVLVGCGATYGAGGGVLVGMLRPRGERLGAVQTLGFLGAVSGATAGVAAVGAIFLDRTYPLLSSTLALSGVGLAAGLCGYQFAPSPAPPPNESLDDMDEPDAPAVRVEWLLREPKRPWRVSRALLRVLPVVAVAVAALVWGVVAENASLFAVAGLGAVAAHAVYRQEKRLDELERRYGSGRDTRPGV